MSYMFYSATAFNQNISNWNTSKVASMSYMFQSATAFNQNLSNWNVSNLSYATDMFKSVTLSTANYDSLLNGWASQTPNLKGNSTFSVIFSGGNSKYSIDGNASRNGTLIGLHNWTITDGGYTPPDYSGLIITNPTTANPLATSSSSNISIYFNVTNSTNEYQTTGVTMNNITIDNNYSTICTSSVTNPAVNSLVGYTDFSDGTDGFWTASGTVTIADVSNICGASNTADIEGGAEYLYVDVDTTGYSSINVSFYDTPSSMEAGECLVIQCDSVAISAYTYGTSGCAFNGAGYYTAILNSTYCTMDSSLRITLDNNGSATNDESYVDCSNVTLRNSSYAGTPSQNFSYIAGVGWQVNVTVPVNSVGTKNLFLNATYSGTTYSNTQVNAICYGSCADTTPPTYSSQGVNTTINGTLAKFYALWTDNSALHPNGQYIFSTNNSGSWVNETPVNFTTTPNWANVTKILSATVGATIGYTWYANDTAGINNNTGAIHILTITQTSTDSCTCPSANTNWAINFSHYCNVTTACNLGTGNLSFTNNTGWCNISALINSKNGFNLYDETAQTIYINGSGGIKLG